MKVIVVTGVPGTVKTTLSKLLVGILNPTKGTYQFDNLDFSQIQADHISNNIALVLQDSEIFDLSLRENITLMRNLPPAALNLAIEIAYLQPVIDKLPSGLDTILGEKGYRLSGGERQRIGIARAIYRNPQIIIFDEATSSLDVQTEKIIRDNLAGKLGQKTTIWITHRTATLEHCDLIYSIEKGKLVKVGSYKELFTKIR